MGRVERLILLVVVSVCVVFCVLCCLQNNPVFSSVTYLIFQKMKIMSYVFWRVSLLRPETKSSSPLSGGCAIIITTGKKNPSRLSGGCTIVFTTGKKSSSRLSGGCAIVIKTGKKSSSRLSGRCAIVITTGKKNSSLLSGGLCCCVNFLFWQEIGFGCTYFYVLGVPDRCGVVLVFLVLAGNSF